MVAEGLTTSVFICPNCKQSKALNQTPGNIEHHMEHCTAIKFKNPPNGIQTHLGQSILGKEVKDAMREKIALLPFISNVPDHILREGISNPYFHASI